MKKFLLLFMAATFTFTSCGDDDDATSQDQIIGVWTLHKELENGVEYPLTDCDKQEKLTFEADGTAGYEYYEQENGDGPCILEESDSGTWENDGNNVYTLSNAFGSTSVAITFEGNTFYYEDTYEDDGETFVDRYVYIKN